MYYDLSITYNNIKSVSKYFNDENIFCKLYQFFKSILAVYYKIFYLM